MKVAAAAAAAAQAKEDAAAAVIATVVEVASIVPEIKGQAIVTRWKARLVSMSALSGIPAGDIRLTFLAFDAVAANKFATATKGAVGVPGVEFVAEKGMSSTSR